MAGPIQWYNNDKDAKFNSKVRVTLAATLHTNHSLI